MGEGLTPTHFNWRWDVANLVASVQNSFFTLGNTYFNHPTGQWLDAVSVDFWSPFIGWDGVSGRGNDIDPGVGHQIVDFVWFNHDGNPENPWVRWYIWQGWEYDQPWEWRGTGNYISYPYPDPNDQHFDHVHFTFW